MSLAAFLRALFEDGRVAVPEPGPLPDAELRAADAALEEFERRYRRELPGEPPRFDPAAARWAAVLLFRACQAAVYRDIDLRLLNRELGTSLEVEVTPEAVYSVDLVLRYLPDVLRFARSAADGDPLVDHLRRFARAWPLSSVGVEGLGELAIDSFADCPPLAALYADRIIAAGDEARLNDPRVRARVAAALGLHPELAPKIARKLEEEAAKEPTEETPA